MNKRIEVWMISAFFLILGFMIGTQYDRLFSFEPNAPESISPHITENTPVYRSGPFRVSVAVNPETPQVGDNTLVVKIMDSQGQPVPDAQIHAYGQMPAMGTMPAMRAPAELEEKAPGEYQGPIDLEMSGSWPLSIEIKKPGIGSTSLSFDMATGRQGLEITSGGTRIESRSSQKETQDSHEKSIVIPSMDKSGVVHAGNFRVVVSLDPPQPRIGTNNLTVQVSDHNSKAITNAQVRAVVQLQNFEAMADSVMTQTDADSINKVPRIIEIGMNETTPGHYIGSFELPSTGQWALAVDVEKEEIGHADLVFDMRTGTDSEKELKLVTTTPEGIAYYTCSMHTSVRAAGPGQCPICSMDLVPVTKEEVQTGTINVDSRRRQLIGLKTAVAIRRELESTIRAVGEVTYDETRLSDVNLRFDAWIGELKADYVGKYVKQGEMLFSVYGPDLLAAQQEYLEILKRRPGQNHGLAEAARKRLSLWGMTAGQIRHLEKRGKPLDYVPILAPRSGTVVEKLVVMGTANKAGTKLMRIADLSSVWVEADVYESELDLVKTGMQAIVALPYMPGRTYVAKVNYIYPYLKGATRTGRIRLVLDNPEGELKPEMYAEVRLKAKLGERLAIPEEAVLFAGDSRVVFVDLGDGKLKPSTITTGVRTQEYIEVLEGLKPGDRVVTSGNFLIAAESRLKSGTAQW